MFALYHPFAYPYCGILYRYGIEAYQAGCRRNLYQGYGRYRPSGIFRQDCGKHQGCSSGHSHPVSQPCGTRFQHGKHPCGLWGRLRLYRRGYGAAFMGYGTCRPAQRAGHAEGCRFQGSRNQYGSVHESTCTYPGVYGWFPRSVHQPEEPSDELVADWSGTSGRHDGKSDGGPGIQSGIYQQVQGQT